MVNDQIDWAEWVDLLWITSKALHSIAHSSEIDNSGYTTKEILLVDVNKGTGMNKKIPSTKMGIVIKTYVKS